MNDLLNKQPAKKRFNLANTFKDIVVLLNEVPFASRKGLLQELEMWNDRQNTKDIIHSNENLIALDKASCQRRWSKDESMLVREQWSSGAYKNITELAREHKANRATIRSILTGEHHSLHDDKC